jgi:hypothetical protein
VGEQSDAEYSRETARQIAEAVRVAEEGRRRLAEEEAREQAEREKKP